MGFVQNLMTKLFAKQTQAATEAWAKNLTDEEIAEQERQGIDMTPYRQIRDAERERKRQIVERNIAAQDLSKLDAYKTMPLPDDFIEAVAKMAPCPVKRLQKAKIVYAGVVQAHSALWEPQEDDFDAGIVFVFALDEAHRYDTEWARRTAEQIGKMKRGEVPLLPENLQFIETLRNDQSFFCFPLAPSLSEGADAWCATFMDIRKPKKQLPLGYLPGNRILPIVIYEQPVFNQFAPIALIPPVYYTKSE